MALSCFISPSKLAICSLKSSCSYTYRKNENKELVQANSNKDKYHMTSLIYGI